MKKYSLTEVHNNLSMLIHQMEEMRTPIELTRRGKAVAVLVPKHEYDDLTKATLSPWDTLMAFRKQEDIESLNLDTDIFNERKVLENEQQFNF
jgi:prevent-host-death family protein